MVQVLVAKTQKRCSCGRNEGGLCQCNNKKLNASGVGNQNPCPSPCYPCFPPNGKCCGINEFGDCGSFSPKQAQGGTKPSAKREVADPTGFSCDSVPCGRMRGGGRLRCPSGCKCKNNFCVSKSRRVAQGVSPKAKSRKDRMMNFHHSKSNFNARQVGFEDVKSRFNAFYGCYSSTTSRY